MTFHVLQLRGVCGPLNLPESDARVLAHMTPVPTEKRLQLGILHTPDRYRGALSYVLSRCVLLVLCVVHSSIFVCLFLFIFSSLTFGFGNVR